VPASCEGRAYLAVSYRRRGCHPTGAASLPIDVGNLASWGVKPLPALGFRCPGHLLGHGPHEGTAFAGNGHDHLVGIFAFGHALALPLAEADRGLPPAGLERCRALCQAQGQGPTAVGGIPIRPGACDQGTTGMSMAGLGQAPLRTPRPTGIVRGCAPQRMHELSGGLEAGQIAQRRRGRPGHRALDPAQGLEGFDHWSSAPGFALLVAFEVKTAQPCRLCRHGLDVCLQDDLLRRCGPPHRAEPAPVGGTPVGPPCRADIVPQPACLQT
jgi:hypothetical protein